ncbi:MAG: HNH endonuclease [Pseudomonadota bacterium]
MIKIDRNQVTVPSIGKNYRTPEILKALGKIFYNKCYLCEIKKNHPDNFEIDHLIPVSENEALKYEWHNLYLCCTECNGYKSDEFINILDPCQDDVEIDIIYELMPIDHQPRFYSSNPQNKTINNTVTLLEKVHNGDDVKSINKTASLRNAIDRRAKQLMQAMLNFFRAKAKEDELAKQKSLREIKEIVSRYSPYTMLMRSLAKEYHFEDLFD